MKSSPVYVYSINQGGKVIERSGVISRKTDNSVVVTVCAGQRVVCGRHADEVCKGVMWSRQPNRRRYAEQMLEILVHRRAEYQDKVNSTTRRITEVRKYAE